MSHAIILHKKAEISLKRVFQANFSQRE